MCLHDSFNMTCVVDVLFWCWGHPFEFGLDGGWCAWRMASGYQKLHGRSKVRILIHLGRCGLGTSQNLGSLKSPLWPCSRWQIGFLMNLQGNYSNIVANVTKVLQWKDFFCLEGILWTSMAFGIILDTTGRSFHGIVQLDQGSLADS